MKIEQSQKTDVITLSEGEETKFTLSPDKMGMVVNLLSQYSDVISSIVREISSNAIDSHMEARDLASMSYEQVLKNYHFYETVPEEETRRLMKHCRSKEIGNFQVRFENAGFLSDDPIIAIEDFGVGISPQRFQKIYSQYFSSTKNETDNQIGAFGLGAKTPLGYSRQFSLITRYDGWEYRYLIHKGDEVPVAILEEKAETDKGNGTTVEIGIKDSDTPLFQKACKTQLAYFPDVDFYNAEVDSDIEIIIGQHFAVRSDLESYDKKKGVALHMCIGHVYYPLNTNQINHPDIDFGYPGYLQNCNFALRFSQDEFKDLDLMWNRENVEYTVKTRESIAIKILSAIEELNTISKSKRQNYTDPITYIKELRPTSSDKPFIRIGEKCHIEFDSSLKCFNDSPILYKLTDLEPGTLFFDEIFKVKTELSNIDKFLITKQYSGPSKRQIATWCYAEDKARRIIFAEDKEVLTAGKKAAIQSTLAHGERAYIVSFTDYDSFRESQNLQYRWRSTGRQISQEAKDHREAFVSDLHKVLKERKTVRFLADIEPIKSTSDVIRDEIKTGVMCNRVAEAGYVHHSGRIDWPDRWKQENEYPIQHHAKFINRGHLLIYGGMDEEDQLFMAQRILTVSSVNDDHFKVIKISETNKRHMEYLEAIHVNDFILMRVPQSRIISRTISRHYVDENLDKKLNFYKTRLDQIGSISDTSEYSLSSDRVLEFIKRGKHSNNNLTEDVFDFYEDYEQYRRKEVQKNGRTSLRPVYDFVVRTDVENIFLLMKQFPLLGVLSTYDVSGSLLADYLQLKENRLWVLRLQQKHNKHV